MLDEYVNKNNEEIAHRTIDGEAVIVNLKDSTFHTLNAVATFIWEQADGQIKIKQMIEKICQEFEVDRDTAEKDCLEFLGQLMSKGLAVLSHNPVKG
ncbi:MAG TPA: PqqD family protein [Thermodesulfobacteriota bacterium]|nr:PqqD family protein [Thermodesulfobacteriota bacterium]